MLNQQRGKAAMLLVDDLTAHSSRTLRAGRSQLSERDLTASACSTFT
jgi:hypothetical protein